MQCHVLPLNQIVVDSENADLHEVYKPGQSNDDKLLCKHFVHHLTDKYVDLSLLISLIAKRVPIN